MKHIKISVFLLLVSISVVAQKKDNNTVVINPAKVVSISDDKIKKQIIADWHDEYAFHLERNNGINRKYLLYSPKRETYKSENPRVAVFFLSKQELIDLLYGNDIDRTQGFHLFFTKYNYEIVLTNANNKLQILNPDFKLLQATKNPFRSIKNESLTRIRETFPYKNKIKSYFIGRHCLMLSLTDRFGKIDATVSGVQLDIRESNKHEYSILFTLIRTNKSEEFIGVATFKNSETTTINGQVVNVEPIGGGASSRPCPTHCPEE